MDKTFKVDIDTPEKQKKVIDDFISLQSHPAWMIIKYNTEENIKYLIEEQLVNGDDKQTMEDIKRIRDKIKLQRDIISSPEKMISFLTGTIESKEDLLDPYE